VTKPLGNRRLTGDEQYYTPARLADKLVDQLFATVADAKSARFLEPAGGTGSFIEALKRHGSVSITAFDTHPKHQLVQRADFLSQELPETDFITVTNPPFGRNNQLAVPFFNHAAKYSRHIAFLVPRSWRKWSVINRLDPHFHLISDTDVEVIIRIRERRRSRRQKRSAQLFSDLGKTRNYAAKNLGAPVRTDYQGQTPRC